MLGGFLEGRTQWKELLFPLTQSMQMLIILVLFYLTSSLSCHVNFHEEIL